MPHQSMRLSCALKSTVIALAVIPAMMLAAASAQAETVTDPMIEGAKQCTWQMPRFEREYGIPVHLLSAISSNETGRWHEGLGIILPWPWTINVEGKGYYFSSKQEAIAAVKKHRARGAKSIDVGCMQVNLVHHKNAFASLDEAFDPEKNVAYAASFLRNLYEEGKTWRQAAAAYHSRTPSNGNKYVARVYDRWYTIIDRVRLARAASAQGTQQASLTAEELASAREASKGGKAAKDAVAAAASTNVKVAKPSVSYKDIKVADASSGKPYRPSGVKVIQVKNAEPEKSEATRRASEILVVRPQTESNVPQAAQQPPGLVPVATYTPPPSPYTVQVGKAMRVTPTEAQPLPASQPAQQQASIQPATYTVGAPSQPTRLAMAQQAITKTVQVDRGGQSLTSHGPRFIFSD